MLIRRIHAAEILRTLRGEEPQEPAALQLRRAGLISQYGTLTEAGRLVAEAVEDVSRELGDPAEWPEDRWVGTDVLQMIEVSERSAHVVEAWVGPLSSRGFLRDGELTEAAGKVVDAYSMARPSLYLTSWEASALQAMPPGPTDLREVTSKLESMGFSTAIIDSLEAMRLASIGAPDPREPSPTFTLTGAGRLVRQAVSGMPLPEGGYAIDPDVVEALLSLARGAFTQEQEELLVSRGLAHASKLTWPGRYLLTAVDKLSRPRAEQAPIGVTAEEVRLLLSIREIWRKHETNPEVTATKERIVGQVAEDWGIEGYDPTSALYTLEALDLITSETMGGRLVYRLTEWGEEILKVVGEKPRDVSSVAVKAVLYSLGERAPTMGWVRLAKDQGLVASGGITWAGMRFARLSGRIRRKPHVTAFEADVLRRIPEGKSASLDEICSAFEDSRAARVAIEKLECRGFLDILPNDRVVLTEAGAAAKYALLGVRGAHPINPVLARILSAAAKHGLDNVKEIERETRLDFETINKMRVVIRRFGYYGRTGVTDRGRALLRLIEILESRRRESEEVREEESAFHA